MKNFCKKALDWDSKDFPPVWRAVGQLAVIVLTVLVTLYFAPSINKDFESEKRRTAFYVGAIQSLNDDTKVFLADITVYLDRTARGKDASDQKENIRATATKLQWRAIEYSLVFKGSDMDSILNEYLSSLQRLNTAIDNIDKDSKSSSSNIEQATQDFGHSVGRLVKFMASRADV